ncbi:MAG TPA: 23S rRNA (adenine(2503)-C(2))-methyltransferase RlmN [Thermoanaerobaculia bacterium]|nr:23S rRNA (adenine(2503)-C(2))-methyltransferase RlmN [Thermoanaerobaculia bacterium]HUM28758.1 23S rRNA (adenine(2503)-C(2))-methyltransferase RlmN [Thermoanaerobaculia bacterium]HXK67992.1 23S rRNA (adenine(2503)-C(2))-methyltransferase RlmN [Thermoanaerobaculia bacterium]
MIAPLLSLSRAELESSFLESGLPIYKSRQVYHWVSERYITDYEAMTNLSKDLRLDLSRRYPIILPDVDQSFTSSDGTVKYRIRMEDDSIVESVRMPGEDRTTLCLSSQAGCPLGCAFCLTGKTAGRNLKPEEIIGQFLLTVRGLEASRVNIVFMGMGEPLLNLKGVKAALAFMYSSISPKRITVSTVGLIREIQRLGEMKPHPRLALSLSAPTDDLRRNLVPASRLYSLTELFQVLDEYPRRRNERVTLEYVMLKDVNDRPDQAEEINRLLKGRERLYKVNLIPFNPVEGLPYQEPPEDTIQHFLRILLKANLTVTIRRSHGRDIGAACGQLASRQA